MRFGGIRSHLLLGTLAAAAPSQLFLTEEELTAARGGVPRENISHHSTDTFITPEVDGRVAMEALFYDLNATEAGDEVMMETFHSDGSVFLLPLNHPEYKNSKLFDVLRSVALRNVTLRMLVNWNGFDPVAAFSFCATVNSYCKEVLNDGFDCCAPESRHNAKGGSLHNKMWIIQSKSNTVVYDGGMDITGGRWDTRAHDMSDDRKAEPGQPGMNFWGWHDILYRIQGNGVRDYMMHFFERWNFKNQPFPVSYTVKPYQWREPVLAPDVADKQQPVQMQLLRTLACRGAEKHYGLAAPKGEISVLEGFRKLVKSCRHTLVLEDQFTFFDEAFEIVGEALEHLENVVIFTDSGNGFKMRIVGPISVETAGNMRTYYQRRAWDKMLNKAKEKDPNAAKKIHTFQLAKPNATKVDVEEMIYLHTKNYYCDDRFAMVGSAGLERVGMTNDIELAALVADEGDAAGPNTFVGKLRRNFWSEYLGLGNPDDPLLLDVDASIAEMERQAEAGTGMLRKFWPKEIPYSFMYGQIYNFLQPEGRCDVSEEVADEQSEILVV